MHGTLSGLTTLINVVLTILNARILENGRTPSLGRFVTRQSPIFCILNASHDTAPCCNTHPKRSC